MTPWSSCATLLGKRHQKHAFPRHLRPAHFRVAAQIDVSLRSALAGTYFIPLVPLFFFLYPFQPRSCFRPHLDSFAFTLSLPFSLDATPTFPFALRSARCGNFRNASLPAGWRPSRSSSAPLPFSPLRFLPLHARTDAATPPRTLFSSALRRPAVTTLDAFANSERSMCLLSLRCDASSRPPVRSPNTCVSAARPRAVDLAADNEPRTLRAKGLDGKEPTAVKASKKKRHGCR